MKSSSVVEMDSCSTETLPNFNLTRRLHIPENGHAIGSSFI